MNAIEEWLKSGKYLPAPLRDFHAAKSVFKTIHCRIKEDPAALIKRPDWIAGQCYVIDTFLWFMARRGWTLQRSRASLPFRDLADDVEEVEAYERGILAKIVGASSPVAIEKTGLN